MFPSSEKIHNVLAHQPTICRILQTLIQHNRAREQRREVPHNHHTVHNRSSVPNQIVGQICTTNWGSNQYNTDVKNQHLGGNLRSTERPKSWLEQNTFSISRLGWIYQLSPPIARFTYNMVHAEHTDKSPSRIDYAWYEQGPTHQILGAIKSNSTRAHGTSTKSFSINTQRPTSQTWSTTRGWGPSTSSTDVQRYWTWDVFVLSYYGMRQKIQSTATWQAGSQ